MQSMPVLFISHGSPLSLLDTGMAQTFAHWRQTLPRPQAILIFSAHWETRELRCGETIAHQELIYDFYGFPDVLYERQYAAPGAPQLAADICELLGLDSAEAVEQRGLDHGVWSPLSLLWPAADIPVLQLSLPRPYANGELFDLGRRLQPLRAQDVLLIGSGALTHNLRAAFRGGHSEPPAWVTDFEQWVIAALRANRGDLLHWESLAPHALLNHPTPEHFRPLLVACGAATDDEAVSFPVDGYEMAVVSNLCVQFG